MADLIFLWLLMYLSADALGAKKMKGGVFSQLRQVGLTQTLNSPSGREFF